MNKKIFVLAAYALCSLRFALSAEAQQPKKVPRIGYLSGTALPLLGPRRGIPAGAARAWVCGREKHCH